MPPRADKAPAKKRGAKRGADDDTLSLADLVARCTRADLEALLLEHEDDLPDLRAAVEARLKPEQVRASGVRSRGLQRRCARARRHRAPARCRASGAACDPEPDREARRAPGPRLRAWRRRQGAGA